MQLSNREQVGRILEEVNGVLKPFLEPRLASHLGERWPDVVRDRTPARPDRDPLEDVAATLAITDRFWRELFPGGPLTRMERSLVIELLEWRHRWAHAEPFSEADVSRVRISADRLLDAIGRPPTPAGGFARIDAVGASLSEPPDEPASQDAQSPLSTYQLAPSVHYRTPSYSLLDKYGLSDVRGLLVDKALDTEAVVAEIVGGVEDAVRSGALTKGDRVSPSQVALPPEASPDLTILAFRTLEQMGVLELERLGEPVWLVR